MESTQNLGRDKLSNEETCLIAPCGIYCGACDVMLGKSIGLAKEMHRIINGFNIADVGPYFLGIEQERIIDFLKILEQWSKRDKCSGCQGGGGIPRCPIRACAHSQGFISCAECESMPCNLNADNEKRSVEAAGFQELVTRRYTHWNIKNFERIREVGYRQFIDELQEKVRDGFMTSDVISSEMVITEAMKKAQDQRSI